MKVLRSPARRRAYRQNQRSLTVLEVHDKSDKILFIIAWLYNKYLVIIIST